MNVNVLFVCQSDEGRYELRGGVNSSFNELYETLGVYQTEADALHELDIICQNQTYIYWVGVTTEFTR